MMTTSHLFSEFRLKDVILRNRIGVSPMCMYSSKDGVANDWHLVHLGSRAVGGAALVICEATAVCPDGRISPQDAGLWNDAQIEPLARINHFIAAHGAVPGIQLGHAGRKASTFRPWEGNGQVPESAGGWLPVGPGATAFRPEQERTPHALTRAEIAGIVENFCDAAGRALAAGYRWLELHGAHGYLAHQFLSPLSNTRTDEYGGSFENRLRFTLETTRAVRAVWPEGLPLTWRISATDWVEGGWTPEDSVALALRLQGGRGRPDRLLQRRQRPARKDSGGAQLPGVSVRAVRREAGIATAAVGLITEAAQADAIIREGQADLVLLGARCCAIRTGRCTRRSELGQENALKTSVPPPYQRGF